MAKLLPVGAARRGLTLLELLLVVTIAGSVMALVGTRLMAPGHDQGVAAVAARCEQIDRRLRVEARRSQQLIAVELRADGWYRQRAGHQQQLLSWPKDVRVRATDLKDQSVQTWVYNAHGRTIDYRLTIQGRRQRQVMQQVVAGLSGQWAVVDQ